MVLFIALPCASWGCPLPTCSLGRFLGLLTPPTRPRLPTGSLKLFWGRFPVQLKPSRRPPPSPPPPPPRPPPPPPPSRFFSHPTPSHLYFSDPSTIVAHFGAPGTALFPPCLLTCAYFRRCWSRPY